MADPLLVVEDAFVARGPGVLVMPRFTTTSNTPIDVRLERPDGTSLDAHATIDVAHMRGAQGTYAMYRLQGVKLEDVPVGTKIYAR